MTSTYLTAEFVERRLTTIPPVGVPDSWGVDRGGHYFQLDLKMCQISALHFDFQWGDERWGGAWIGECFNWGSFKADVCLG